MVSVSDAWAGLAIAGPKARDVVAELVDDFDVGNEAFPFLSAAEITVCGGVPAKLLRISFSGELGYELYVPYGYGDAVIRQLVERGSPYGLIPYGLEALGIMRIEKGHVAGSEINGWPTADDLGLGWMVSPKKEHAYIGRMMSAREGLNDPGREQLVGLKAIDPSEPIPCGAHLIGDGALNSPEADHGYITAVTWSPTLNGHIALGLLKRGRERHGEQVRAANPLQRYEVMVEVCDPVFYDPENARVRD